MSIIMKFTKHALGNLFSKPATSGYPFVQPNYPARTRGRVAIDIDACIFCGACQRKCPSGAITVDRNAKTWTIERMGCVQCANCVEGCPKKCLSMEQLYTEPGAEKVVDTIAQPQKEAAALPKGDVVIDKDNCVFCGLCAKNCPAGVITVDRGNKSWEIDKDNCAQCGLCVEKCPKKCLSMGNAAPSAANPAPAAAPEEK